MLYKILYLEILVIVFIRDDIIVDDSDNLNPD